jgi:uncharacterized protein
MPGWANARSGPGAADCRLGPDWLTGGEFGVEASIVTVALLLVLTGIILAVASRRGRMIVAP